MQETQTPNPLQRLKVLARVWPVYVVLAVVLGVTYYAVRHRQEGTADPILPPVVSLKQDIEVQFSDVIMQGRQHGVQRWVIQSPKVSLSKDGRYTYFEPNPAGKFVNLKDWQAKEGETDGKVRSMVWKAKKAAFDSFTEDLTMEGSAVITTDASDVIKTEKVEYLSRTKQVNMPKPVDVKMKDGATLKANEMTANTDAEIMEFRGKVDLKTTVNDEDNPQ